MSNEQLMERLFDLEKKVKTLQEDVKRLKDRSRPFSPPTPLEVGDYFILKESNSTEAEKFFNYYSSKDWMVGKSKMKDWKAAARNWIGKQPKKKVTIFDL